MRVVTWNVSSLEFRLPRALEPPTAPLPDIVGLEFRTEADAFTTSIAHGLPEAAAPEEDRWMEASRRGDAARERPRPERARARLARVPSVHVAPEERERVGTCANDSSLLKGTRPSVHTPLPSKLVDA